MQAQDPPPFGAVSGALRNTNGRGYGLELGYNGAI
jgi:hypothetical protein